MSISLNLSNATAPLQSLHIKSDGSSLGESGIEKGGGNGSKDLGLSSADKNYIYNGEGVQKLNKANKGGSKIKSRERWGPGMASSSMKDKKNIKKFLSSMERLAGPAAPQLLTAILNPQKGSTVQKSLPMGIKSTSASPLRQTEPHSSQDIEMSAQSRGQVDVQDLTQQTSNNEDMTSIYSSVKINMAYNPNLDQMNLTLTKDNIKTFGAKTDRSISDSNNNFKVHKEMNSKQVKELDKQIKKHEEAAAKQMKSPVLRLFTGIGKMITGLIVGAVTFDFGRVIKSAVEGAADIKMAAGIWAGKSYSEIMKGVDKILNSLSGSLWKVISTVSTIVGVTAGVLTAGAGIAMGLGKLAMKMGGKFASIATKTAQLSSKAGQKGLKMLTSGKKWISSKTGTISPSWLKKAGASVKDKLSFARKHRFATMSVSGMSDIAITSSDDYVKKTAESDKSKSIQEHQSFEDDLSKRYAQLSRNSNRLAQILAQDSAASYTESLERGHALLRKASEQKAQILSKRL